MRSRLHLFTGLAALIAGGGMLGAQSLSTGALAGTVTDPSGKPIPGALVRAVSSQTTRTATSDSQGRFNLTLLGLGQWTLTTQSKGFQTMVARTSLGINETRTVNFRMVAVSEATVVVVAQAQELDFTATQVNTSFDAATLTKIPGNFISLTPLDDIVGTVPGVQANGSNSFQVFGGTADQNLFVVDGNNTNSTAANGAQMVMSGLPPREFLQSVEVVTGGFGAEYNVLGGVVNMSTKTGSNTWTGEAYAYTNFPNSEAKRLFNANAGQSQPAGNATHTRYGATVGGPILKDRLFLFVGAQGSHVKAPASGLLGANWNGFRSSSTKVNGPNTLSLKLNWIINSDHELVLADTEVNQNISSGAMYPPTMLFQTGSNNTGTSTKYDNRTTNLTWNWNISPQLFLVTSIGDHTDKSRSTPSQASPDGSWNPIYDYRYFLTGPGASAENKPNGFEFFSFTGGTGTYTSRDSNPNKQGRVDLTWFPANHTVKVGYSRQEASYDHGTNATRSYSIYSPESNYGMTGDPGDLERLEHAAQIISQKGTYIGYYAKDLWEVMPGLRLEYGVRFDSFTLTGNYGVNAGRQMLKFSNLGRQLQPRLGVSWDVHRDGKTKLYANFGRFFETMPLNNFSWAASSSYLFSYWNASQWTYNSNYGVLDPAYTINNDPATGQPYAPYLTIPYGSSTQNPPMANDLRLPHKDMILIGGDQVLDGGWVVGGSWRWWTLKDPLTTSYFVNPDGTDAFPAEVTAPVIWNPRPGPVTFTAGSGEVLTYDSPYPDPKEIFLGLNLHATLQRETWSVRADYTWTHHYGNFRGLSTADTTAMASSGFNPGRTNNTSDWAYYQTINSGNNEANPVHEFKVAGSVAIPVFGQKLNVAPAFTWQSGYGLTRNIPISSVLPGALMGAYNYTSDNRIMSNMGHTPTWSQLNLTLNMTIKAGPMSITPTASITNFFNARSPQAYDTIPRRAGGVLNPYFAMETSYQTGRAVTAGLSVTF